MIKMEKALELVKEEIPDFSWNSYWVNEEGWEKRCIIVDSQKVISFIRKPEHLKKYIDHQKLLADLFQNCEIKVPQYDHISSKNNFIMYNIIKGTFVTDEYLRAKKKLQSKIGNNIGKFLKFLHSLPIDQYNLPSNSLDKEYEEIVDGVEQYLRVKITKDEYDQVRDFLKYYKSLISRRVSNCIIHADFRSDHILWDESNDQLGIIDFGDCCIGDPAKDFARIPEYKKLSIFDEIMKEYDLVQDEYFFERIDAHIRKEYLIAMLDALEGYPSSFEMGYNCFFRTNKEGAY